MCERVWIQSELRTHTSVSIFMCVLPAPVIFRSFSFCNENLQPSTVQTFKITFLEIMSRLYITICLDFFYLSPWLETCSVAAMICSTLCLADLFVISFHLGLHFIIHVER
ncbi:hypothetical protein KC19_4G006700 [Ceratodon purpureus]|uniref:Uncharacterized protein n=1 Tax=Ceratodon purpureus TaxID=3225 RepID=A0A8T0I699_CERPU|nr:hypothetical protein KC19_4G006700 [Ceratodon purpureus]